MFGVQMVQRRPSAKRASKIRSTAKEPATSWDQGSRAIQGMSFDEAKAFFYDMHNVEGKGKAKAL